MKVTLTAKLPQRKTMKVRKNMSKEYKVEIIDCNKELTKKEQVKLCMLQSALELNEEVKKAPVEMRPDLFATLHITNPKTKVTDENGNQSRQEKEYDVFVVRDKEGNYYQTSSEPFMQSLRMIANMMEGEEYEIRVLAKPSSNFAGQYLTCEIV